MIIAAYVEELQRAISAPSVKQHLAGVRMLFDYLVVSQVMPFNPAAAVRGPKHVVKVGKTPVLSTEEARTLLDSIDVSHVVGLRDRALIGVMVYSFARIGARRRRENESEGLLHAGEALLVSLPRERRQVPRRAGTPQGG